VPARSIPDVEDVDATEQADDEWRSHRRTITEERDVLSHQIVGVPRSRRVGHLVDDDDFAAMIVPFTTGRQLPAARSVR
jgi:hypothetical protein